VRARLRGALVGFAATGTLVVEAVAEPAAERGPEHEADGTTGGRADHAAPPETDRLFLAATRVSSFAAIPRPREARVASKPMIAIMIFLWMSFSAWFALKRKVVDTALL
jgi:hypothetical protein